MVAPVTLRRLERGIETLAAQMGERRPVRMLWLKADESLEEAKARYLAENPDAAGCRFLVVRWGPHDSPAPAIERATVDPG
jgi:hypothetical protein